MMMDSSTQILEKRAYLWALSDWKREIGDGFPILSRVEDSGVRLVLRIMESLGDEEKWLLAQALVKRFRKHLLRGWGETMSETDLEYESIFLNELNRSMRDFSSWSGVTDSTALRRAHRSELKSALVRALEQVFTTSPEEQDATYLVYRERISHWQISTYVDIGSRTYQLSYGHHILGPTGISLVGPVSVVSWLGITSEYTIHSVDESEIKPTAETVAILCSHFFGALPGLLEDLPIP